MFKCLNLFNSFELRSTPKKRRHQIIKSILYFFLQSNREGSFTCCSELAKIPMKLSYFLLLYPLFFLSLPPCSQVTDLVSEVLLAEACPSVQQCLSVTMLALFFFLHFVLMVFIRNVQSLNRSRLLIGVITCLSKALEGRDP